MHFSSSIFWLILAINFPIFFFTQQPQQQQIAAAAASLALKVSVRGLIPLNCKES